MKKNKVEIFLLIDKSGSMASLKDETEKMVKNYIQSQKNIEKDIYLSIKLFNVKSEVKVSHLNIKEYNENEFVFEPNGWTALYDNMGESIQNLGEYFGKLAEPERPEKVFFVVITDGYDNHSKKFNANKIKEITNHQTDKYNWSFLFLGANIDSFEEGKSLGYKIGNTINWKPTKCGILDLSDVLSTYTTRAMYCADYNTEFTAEERAKLEKSI